jgi:hypothetical protein
MASFKCKHELFVSVFSLKVKRVGYKLGKHEVGKKYIQNAITKAAHIPWL